MPVPSIENGERAPSTRVTRRGFLKRATLVAGTAALGLAGYSGLIEPNEVDVRKVEFMVKSLPAAFDGFKIALMSDLHFGPYTGPREIGAGVKEVNKLSPDLVAILGDFVTEPAIGSGRA